MLGPVGNTLHPLKHRQTNLRFKANLRLILGFGVLGLSCFKKPSPNKSSFEVYCDPVLDRRSPNYL